MLNKYAFVFEKANLNDIVDLFLFCAQAEIEIPYVEEQHLIKIKRQAIVQKGTLHYIPLPDRLDSRRERDIF